MNTNTPLPEIQKTHRLGHYAAGYAAALAIGGMVGVWIDSLRLGVMHEPGLMLTGLFVVIMLALQVSWAMRRQRAREVKAVSGCLYVGKTSNPLGYRFYFSHWPTIDADMARDMVEAEWILQRAMANRKGYIAMSRMTKARIRMWLAMQVDETLSSEQAIQARQLICWRILRDNHCG